MRKIFFFVLIVSFHLVARAQSETYSPYSKYGFGELNSLSTGFTRGMNGVGIGFWANNQVNSLNPASYAQIDSLTFIFDAGVSGQLSNYAEGNKSKNIKTANFDYAVMGFRLAKGLGMSAGIQPLTSMGYNFVHSGKVENSDITALRTYNGDGGLKKVYLGMGYRPFKGFSIGASVAYLWGGYDKSFRVSYSDAAIRTMEQREKSDVRNFVFDFGAQYTLALGKKNNVTLGVVFAPQRKIGGKPTVTTIYNNVQTFVADTLTLSAGENLTLPASYGAGLMWNYNGKLRIGIDYQLQKWGDVAYPILTTSTAGQQYLLQKNVLKDRYQIGLGFDYVHSEMGRSFMQRIHYKGGVSYANTYYGVNGSEEPKELSATLGVSVPIVNGYNNRSLLNVSAQYVRQTSKSYIDVNTFRINIGFTFNERWFMKWKVE